MINLPFIAAPTSVAERWGRPAKCPEYARRPRLSKHPLTIEARIGHPLSAAYAAPWRADEATDHLRIGNRATLEVPPPIIESHPGMLS